MSKKVLIVEDNELNMKLFHDLLDSQGYETLQTREGLQALALAREHRPDLILMDIKMPRLDGVGATRAIRALDGPQRDIPIIALTANADPDDAKAYLAAGMAAVVEKPIKPERLRLAMNTALEPANAADATFATDNYEAGRLIGAWAKGTLGDAAKDAHIAMLNMVRVAGLTLSRRCRWRSRCRAATPPTMKAVVR